MRKRYTWTVIRKDGKEYLCFMRQDFALTGIEAGIYRQATKYDLGALPEYGKEKEK